MLKCESVVALIRHDKYVIPNIEYKIINEIENDVYFENLIEEVYKSKQGCLIKALSGCGKTEFLKRFIKKVENENLKIEKVGPSNKSARLIRGRTIHKFANQLKMSNFKQKKLIQDLVNVKYIFVDEYGMLTSEFYRLLVFIKRYVPEICILVAGDITQLEPVGDRYKGDYDTSALHYITDGKNLNLRRVIEAINDCLIYIQIWIQSIFKILNQRKRHI
jgi:ATP-dependent exoDNAse (exonuclease V) alpha subunit